MIIPNGTIEVKLKSESVSDFDPETGHPIQSTTDTWGEPIECQYLVDRYDMLARAMQEHRTEQSYTVLIEGQPFDADIVRLSDKYGKVIGEFSVRQIEHLETVGQTRVKI